MTKTHEEALKAAFCTLMQGCWPGEGPDEDALEAAIKTYLSKSGERAWLERDEHAGSDSIGRLWALENSNVDELVLVVTLVTLNEDSQPDSRKEVADVHALDSSRDRSNVGSDTLGIGVTPQEEAGEAAAGADTRPDLSNPSYVFDELAWAGYAVPDEATTPSAGEDIVGRFDTIIKRLGAMPWNGELVRELETVRDEIERLRHENECLQRTIAQRDYPCSPHCEGYLREQQHERRIKELESVLEPFADAAKYLPAGEGDSAPVSLSGFDLRRARSTLSKTQG